MKRLHESNYCQESIDFLLKRSASEIPVDYISTIQSGRMTKYHSESLADWLFTLAEKANLPSKTAQRAVQLVNNALGKVPIKGLSSLELMGKVCLGLSIKYEFGGHSGPGEIQKLGNTPFPIEAIIYTEVLLAKTLSWKFDIPTASELLSLLFENTCERFDYSNLLSQAELYIKA